MKKKVTILGCGSSVGVPRIDNYWGMNKNGGENNHGKILMELRKELIQ